MMSLFDVNEIQEMYVKSKCREAEERGEKLGEKRGEKLGIRRNQYENARKMLEAGKLLVEDIALYTGLSVKEVEEIRDRM